MLFSKESGISLGKKVENEINKGSEADVIENTNKQSM